MPPKDRCPSRCRNTPCDREKGHHGLHFTEDNFPGRGYWGSQEQDPPTAWQLLLNGLVLEDVG